jgi:acyl-CoA-dependent ceramide synthase
LTEFRTVGLYELNWETQQYKCWISQIITFALLACLQALNLFWLSLLLRSAKNYVFDNVRADERSDNEQEDEEEEVINPEETKKTLEEETGMMLDEPAVLTNGKAKELTANPEGIRDRKGGR